MSEFLIALTAILVTLLPLVRAWVKAKLGPARLAAIHQLSQVAVNGAEKLGEAISELKGPDKYAAAAAFLRDAAKRVGLKLTDAEINGFIQSALRNMQQAEAGPPGFTP